MSGSLNVFNHRTNVELNNRLVCFDIKQLGKQLKKLGIPGMTAAPDYPAETADYDEEQEDTENE